MVAHEASFFPLFGFSFSHVPDYGVRIGQYENRHGYRAASL
jgi:hypothetical protein